MGRKTKQIKGYTPEAIKSLFSREEKYTIGMRLYAVYQVSLGQSSRKLQELYNTSFKQILNWVERFEKEGIEGLRDKEKSGRPSKLTESQLQEVKNLVLEKSPSDYGINSATWTGPLLIKYIKDHYQIEYKKAQIYNILKNLGLTYQKGRGIYPEADEQKREDFKEALKKTSSRKQ